MLDLVRDSVLPPEGPTPPEAVSLRRPRLQWAAGALNKVASWGYRLRGKHRYDEFLLEWIAGTPLLVMPSVFNPRLLLTGEFFASQLTAQLIPPDAEVLDMGTGSGVCAVFAARHARRVVAVDINSAAVRCATVNALMNRAEHKIEARHGDLFAPVREDERFDLILFNPPFLRGVPRDDRDRAWRSSDVPERFAVALGAHLKPAGSALVLLSTFGGAEDFLGQLAQNGFDATLFAQREFIAETVGIFRLRLRGQQRSE
jgi:release factor glutamine methyltransferase